jgi:hypothetical protein
MSDLRVADITIGAETFFFSPVSIVMGAFG